MEMQKKNDPNLDTNADIYDLVMDLKDKRDPKTMVLYNPLYYLSTNSMSDFAYIKHPQVGRQETNNQQAEVIEDLTREVQRLKRLLEIKKSTVGSSGENKPKMRPAERKAA